MPEKSESVSRRVYNRNGVIHVSYRGTYYSPPHNTTDVNAEHEVDVAEAPAVHGKKRVSVAQKRSKGPKLVETWKETEVPIEHRQ